jgi:chromosome segregation ATPase
MIDELERRVRTLEEEAEGEKAVTRQVLEQSIRNGDYLLALRSEVASVRVDLHALTSRVDHIAGDVVQANAALVSHGRRLNTLTQDVREIRTRLDGMDTKLDAVLAALAPRDPSG